MALFLVVDLWLVARRCFWFVRVESEDGGRGEGGGEICHRALHCSLHHHECRNVDGFFGKGRCGHFPYMLRVRYISQHVCV